MSMENKFQEAVYRCTSKGLVARFGQDTLPTTTFQNLTNLEVRQENALSLRFGKIPLTVSGGNNAPLAGSVFQLGRLKGLGTNTWRYASAGGFLYRIAGDNPGAWLNIASGLSTAVRPSMVYYTPAFSSTPYLFIADSNELLKDNGTGSPTPWGLLWPPYPITATVFDTGTLGVVFAVLGGFTIVGGSSSMQTPYFEHGIVSAINNDSLVTLAVPTVVGLEVGQQIVVHNSEDINTVYTVQFLDATNNLIFIDNYPSSPPGLVMRTVGLKVDVQVFIIRINTVASAGGTVTITKSAPFTPLQNWNPLTDGTQIPTVDFKYTVTDPTQLASVEVDISTGDGTFTNYFSYVIPAGSLPAGSGALAVNQIPESSFVSHGSPDWTKVASIRLIITSAAGSPASTVFDLYSLTPDFNAGETILGGVDYDWRMTFFNANTGAESNPSSEQIAGSIYNPQGMFGLPVLLQWPNLAPAGATHRRIYRRGGSLAAGWHMIAQLPLNVLQIYDVVSDQVASNGQLLSIDNFPPITSTLPVTVNTTLNAAVVNPPVLVTSSFYPASMANISVNQLITIGQGATQEIVTVVQIFADHFTAYCEFPHAIGEQVYAEAAYVQACNIAAVAFDRGWMAGDPNNPGRLYYSNVGAVEEFGVEAYLDLGNLTDPIMGMIYENGVLNVWTLSTIWMIYAYGGSQPSQQQTDSNHGLFAVLGVIKGEGSSFYLSDDGIYAYSGGHATEASQFLQWIFREYNENTAGPIPVMDLTQRNLTNFGYFQNEIFISYLNINGYRNRVIYSQRDNRWRNDGLSASAQLYETDTAHLIFGDDTGMVYQDRVGDIDITGYSGGVPQKLPINCELTTGALDQGKPNNPKVYQEFVIDINTQGQPVQVYLEFRNLGSILLGTVNMPSRQQVNFSLNNGDGYEDLWVAVDLIGQATLGKCIDIFEFRFKALVESEYRTSFDTWWTKYGTEEYKTAKQGYFEYQAAQPVVVSCFEEGSATASFTFTLPATNGVRAITWVRFPPTKFKLLRCLGTSADNNMQMYESSHIEVKPLCSGKGYTPQRLLM